MLTMGHSTTAPPIAKETFKKGTDLPSWHKYVILFTVSFMCLAATFSSTCLYPATPEIAAEFGTTAEHINVTNAGVLLAMGSSSLLWAPIARTLGRRTAYNAAIAVLFLCSIGTALSINMAMFTAMRVLAGFQGTYNMVAAVGFFMVGSVLGPAIGPLVGGIIVTFASWRIIFWVQTGMVGLGLVLSLLFVPSIAQPHQITEKPSLKLWGKSQVEMLKVFTLLIYPNVFFADLACGLLAWTQYSLLAAPRHLINPRFNLTSPLVSGLFYIAPGAGFLLGSIAGGRFSDMTMAKKIMQRGGKRVPQDRLNSGLIAFFLIIPASQLIYGWCLQYDVGGLALAIVAAFFTGAGLMAAFSSLNTYCAGKPSLHHFFFPERIANCFATEAIPEQRTAVIASKYFIQYIFGASGNAAIVPLIDSIGIGLAATIGVILAISGGILVWTLAKYGGEMQAFIDGKLGHQVETDDEK
ncbi:MFS general substrate transporter [Aureobasidium pullulans]|uniref:MFS general substrate transporter n=1 Tax=Aureobasidium pullulans TaxID=5580 RepID=A0A4S9ESD6_AURPU|nr:MFS general substrate transporter [Aureobasidium pullulans]